MLFNIRVYTHTQLRSGTQLSFDVWCCLVDKSSTAALHVGTQSRSVASTLPQRSGWAWVPACRVQPVSDLRIAACEARLRFDFPEGLEGLAGAALRRTPRFLLRFQGRPASRQVRQALGLCHAHALPYSAVIGAEGRERGDRCHRCLPWWAWSRHRKLSGFGPGGDNTRLGAPEDPVPEVGGCGLCSLCLG